MSNHTHYTDMSYTYDAQQFQNYGQYYDDNGGQYYDHMAQPAMGDMQIPTNQTSTNDQDTYYGSDPYANEPPLLEELEINLNQITQKTWAVLTFKNLDENKAMLHEPDLAGPLVFLMAFGFLLLLTGKVHFGYLYGLSTIGSIIIYSIVYLIGPVALSFGCTVSVLGYCLLPMVMLSGLSILVSLKASIAGNVLTIVAVLWCSIGASNLLVTAIEGYQSRLVIAYPCFLFYTVFTLLTVF